MGSDPWWREILLPDTDRVIAVQAIALLIVSAAAIPVSWRWPAGRLVVIGGILMTWGLFGLRAAH